MTIAQQLEIKEFPFEIKDSKNNVIYHETAHGYCIKKKYDSKSNVVYYEDSYGRWIKKEL